MSAVSYEEAKRRLEMFLKAEEALTFGQEYWFEVSGTRRRVVKADAKWISERIEYYSRLVEQYESGRNGRARVVNVIPRDV